ncbi:MAG: UPF0280 family protein [Rhodospirillales bacterium]|nr:MAG: UPF0280 family protein [Rhodospirillales bacterium]
MLPDGRRLHLQHGPIDLVVEAGGQRREVAAAYAQAEARFRRILGELVGELAALRKPCGRGDADPRDLSPTGRRMVRAVRPHAGAFVTPMAAVAGAVADEILAALRKGRRLERAYVNNGGDIALYLQPGARYTVGLATPTEAIRPPASCTISHDMPVRGIATSGRQGRSFSRGIADAVTVLARDGATADAAATLIANAVDIADPAIRREAAESLDPDSDLGKLTVTIAVGPLAAGAVAAALDAGVAAARRMLDRGLIYGAVLLLQGRYRVVGAGSAISPAALERPEALAGAAG